MFTWIYKPVWNQNNSELKYSQISGKKGNSQPSAISKTSD